MKITFFGAAQNVTGSKHLIQTDNFALLLDCGLHQGQRREANALNQTLPFQASGIDAVILSHAHADHCGMLPVLVKQGFRGPIYATTATSDIAPLILRDSAKIQEQDANYFNDNLPPGGDPIAPLYTEADAASVVPHFRPAPYFRLKPQWTEIAPGIRFKFYDAGHILGSSMVVLEIKEQGKLKRIGFTGDIGKPGAPLLHAPEVMAEPLDLLISECTYGNRNHRPLDFAVTDLERVINTAAERGSKIVVPAFALGRTQEIIYGLHKLTDDGRIKRLSIFIDSPLAINIGEVFAQHTEDFNSEVATDFTRKDELPLMFRNLNYVRTIEESKALNHRPGPFMVISASGMCEGGRVLHHLKNSISDPNNIVLLTGYQAQQTLGRRLQNGISPVNIFGRPHKVRAKILTIDEFSAHADRDSLLSYLRHLPTPPQHIALVHTELPQAESFKKLLEQSFSNLTVAIPGLGEPVEV
jgi:metallo-beta-lactamase family protein